MTFNGDISTLWCALLVFILPLTAFGLMALIHKRLPRNGDYFATAVMGIGLLLSLVIFAPILFAHKTVLTSASVPWLPTAFGHTLRVGILVDNLTATMLVVVTLVSFLVHLFSSAYMKGDIRYGRYYCCLLLFTTSMLGLVLADNLLTLYMFWELVGLSSYLLIGHWYEKKSASDAAFKAFITTRLGDVGMFIGILVCYRQIGSLQYADLFAAVHDGVLSGDLRTIAGLGLFFGAMGKSAQFPLHVWLPDAMEGPTPVSALIHAATMVAAGVYLTGRLLPLFDDRTLLFIAHVGGFTAIFSATIALVQEDIKKVLAYSTVSQLGYMILALGVGGYVSGLFHLTTHAFFKAGLFLGAGAVIHSMHHEQSLWKYGGLWRKMPLTALCYLMATLALVGFPGFSGFWSKDAILADVLIHCQSKGHWFLALAGFSTVLLTAFYMTRQFCLTFLGKPRDRHAYDHAHESPLPMLIPLFVLGFLAIIGGGFGKWFGAANPYAYAAHVADGAHGGGHGGGLNAHTLAMMLSTGLGLSGIGIGLLFYLERSSGAALLNPGWVAARLRHVYDTLVAKYYLDEVYNALFVVTTRASGRAFAWFDRTVIDSCVNVWARIGVLWAWIAVLSDRYLVDGLGVHGIVQSVNQTGRALAAVQTGRLRQYLVLTVAGILIISLVCASLLFMIKSRVMAAGF